MTELPIRYKWLEGVRIPSHIVEALSLYGVQETAGHADNVIILSWAKEIGHSAGIDYDHDEVPWCGLFVAVCIKRSGLPLPDIAVRASSWDNWGKPADEPIFGDILRFQRPGGGHVGFYIGEDDSCYHVLGGNQSDKVCISRIEKARCVAMRRWNKESFLGRVILSNTGEVSKNES